MYYQPQRFQILPPVIKNLLIINGLMFLATVVAQQTMGLDLNRLLGLYPLMSDEFQPFQIVTHMFMHGSLTHIFFNMFALWMFGAALENLWGAKRFLTFYLLTGLGAAFLHEVVLYIEYLNAISGLPIEMVNQVISEGPSVARRGMNYEDPTLGVLNGILNFPTVGASGAVFGILLGFGMTYPNQPIFLYFLFPIKAKYFVAIYGALELWNGLTMANSNIAHFAHLGGMLFGFILIKYWRRSRY